jgi:hypothetical protein
MKPARDNLFLHSIFEYSAPADGLGHNNKILRSVLDVAPTFGTLTSRQLFSFNASRRR